MKHANVKSRNYKVTGVRFRRFLRTFRRFFRQAPQSRRLFLLTTPAGPPTRRIPGSNRGRRGTPASPGGAVPGETGVSRLPIRRWRGTLGGRTLACMKTDSPTPQPGLVRALGPLMATAIVVGTVIGSGVFKKPQAVAANVPDFA